MTIYRVGLTREPKAGGASRSLSPLSYILKTGLRAIRTRPTLIHCNTYFPVYAGEIASFFSGTPLIATFHDIYGLRGWIESQESILWGMAGHIATVLSVKVPHDRIIAVSPQCREKLERLGVHREKITLIPNGVDLKLFDSISPQKIPHRILFVGRLVNFKHVDWLIRAFYEVLKRVPDASLKIVGGGPEQKNLEQLTGELELQSKVTFTGVTPTYQAVVEHFKESEIFVLPSTVEGEAIVLKEAMAAHLPVVAMQVRGSGVQSLVKDNINGLLIRPERRDALKEAIIELLLDDERRKSMGGAGRRFVEEFDWDVIAKRTLEVYSQVLAKVKVSR